MKVIITGVAGFIGGHAARRFLAQGATVIGIDNLSRRGNAENLEELRQLPGDFTFTFGDIRNVNDILRIFAVHEDADVVIHLAGQVAVTTSVTSPRMDFEANALGTFNLLEATRQHCPGAAFLYSSTNKVYGGMEQVVIVEKDGRYAYRDIPEGMIEETPLDFHSPYGCCYSADTDVLTRTGWKRFYDLTPEDEILTYNREQDLAQFQRPTEHFAFPYQGKMYVQTNRKLKTCVTPNHKMLVAWDCDAKTLLRPQLREAQEIAGKPMAYLLGAELDEDPTLSSFLLPGGKAGKHKHLFADRALSTCCFLKFLGWYLSEGHCYENKTTGNCTVTLTTKYRTAEAIEVMKSVGLSPCVDHHHVVATSRQMYEYVKQFGKSHAKFIPTEIKQLGKEHLLTLLKALLDGDGNQQSKNSWRYTTVSTQLADDVQEIALRCGFSASAIKDKAGFYRVSIRTTRTAQCNLGGSRSAWEDYDGMVYCVEVPNSTMLVRQGGHAYFSGNSKGAGDQYVRDYARIYGLKTVVFRQSCIYGTHQFGIEDQGWVAWFTIATILGKPITLFGDGKQVRDVLWVDDLIDLYQAAIEKIDVAAGKVYNAGGGLANTMSLRELLAFLEELAEHPIRPAQADWRPGDQKVFVADCTRVRTELGWSPKIAPKEGVKRLWNWTHPNRTLLEKVLG